MRRDFVDCWCSRRPVDVADKVQVADYYLAAILQPHSRKSSGVHVPAMKISLDADRRATALDGKPFASPERKASDPGRGTHEAVKEIGPARRQDDGTATSGVNSTHHSRESVVIVVPAIT
jgi:hypothetical protein